MIITNTYIIVGFLAVESQRYVAVYGNKKKTKKKTC